MSIGLLFPDYVGSDKVYFCPSDRADSADATYTTGDPLNPSDWFEDPNSSYPVSMHGVGHKDDASYIYIGEESYSLDDKKRTSELRILADNEEEGDEAPRDDIWRTLEADNRDGLSALDPTLRIQDPATGNYTNPANGLYRYIGGLEGADNHGDDGVNVLYYDWHVVFDPRGWPSPIGVRDMEAYTDPVQGSSWKLDGAWWGTLKIWDPANPLLITDATP
jgi:prepilin-type processing-associated H-X9-DG protein